MLCIFVIQITIYIRKENVILMEDCIFCKIIKGEIPSNKVYEDDEILAFAIEYVS